jgi:hypothetical protein
VHNCAILDYNGITDLIILENSAMSGIHLRRDITPIYRESSRLIQVTQKKKQKVKCISLNSLSEEIGTIDFLKIDTEGSEFTILRDFQKLDSLIGIRCEINFDRLFDNGEESSFLKIHELLIKNNFQLLNLDYIGKGDWYSKFVSSEMRYGVLQSTDAVWIKKLELFTNQSPKQIISTALFCILNNAPDVCLYLLEKYSEIIHLNLLDTYLVKLKYEVVRHFYKLKWVPGQEISEHKIFFERIFKEKYPEGVMYNNSEIYNSN